MEPILGTSGDDDPLNGTPGDDIINGLAGADVMVGGTGNDTYHVDNAGDQVIEAAGEGIDKVYATVDYTLAAGQEIEFLRANAGATGLALTGNELRNTIEGAAGDDDLKGGGGGDKLVGGAGNDNLDGGTWADTMAGGTGNDVYFVDNAGDQVIEAAGEGIDKIYTKIDYTLAAGQEIEFLRADAGTVGLALTGNEFRNTIEGGAGNDKLKGGGGGDKLDGGAGNDRLDGGTWADVMAGGTGNDTYYVDNVGDLVIEAAGEGNDTIYTKVNLTLVAGQEIETVRTNTTAGLTLRGNEFDNHLIGGAGNDELDGGGGNDRLDGGDGNDSIGTMGAGAIIQAGNGDDTIRLDGSSSATGSVDGGDGHDTVYSSDLGQFVFSNVETLDTYYGFINGSVAQFTSFDSFTAGLVDPAHPAIAFSLRGAGGTLDFTTSVGGVNSVEIRDAGLTSAIAVTGSVNGDLMFGTAFNDTFKGGAGADTLLGGDGRDTLRGGTGNDVLNGGAGNDRLYGNSGRDTFVFDSPFGAGNNIDTVADFTSGFDTIQLNQAFYFTGLLVGQLTAAQFATNTATGSGPQIVYDTTTGALFFDSNGADAGGASQFATLTGAPPLTNADFKVV